MGHGKHHNIKMDIGWYVLEENFAQIHLPNWQFYLLWAVGQLDMSSPVCVGNTSTLYVFQL